ncbi:ankyrin repeat domain-containing protein, partial [Candidatus Dependentiae bacterium]|nr:ankyrin repeat domain-containing protein [Candidatus Dependentiae bacterium]
MKKLVLLFSILSFFYIRCSIDEQLFLALNTNNLPELERLLSSGADVDACDVNGHTLLHWAALAHNIPAAQILLAHGANVNAQGKEIAISIFLLQGACTLTALDELLSRVIPVYPTIDTSSYGVFVTKQAKFLGIVHTKDGTPQFMLVPENMDNPESHSQMTKNPCLSQDTPQIQVFSQLTPLHWALLSQNTAIVSLLILHGAHSNAYCTLDNKSKARMLHWAEYLSTPAIAEIIKNTALLTTASLAPAVSQPRTHTARVESLVKQLSQATKNGDKQALLKVLKSGINPNRRNVFGSTALHIAAQAGDTDSADLLLAYKADPNAQDRQGNTPLHTVIKVFSKADKNKSYIALAAQLIAAGANVDAQNKEGLTPLACGLIKANELPTLHPSFDNQGNFLDHVLLCPQELMLMLLENGADINLSNGPLLAAAYKLNMTGAIDLLLDYGAFTNTKSPYSKKLPDAAREPNFYKEHINKLLYKGEIDRVIELIGTFKPLYQPLPEHLTSMLYIQLTLGLIKSHSYRALEIALDAYFEKLIKAVEQDDMSQTAHMIKTGFPITMRD